MTTDKPMRQCRRCKGEYTKGDEARGLCVGCLAQIVEIHRIEGIIKYHRKPDNRPHFHLRYDALGMLEHLKELRAELDKSVAP